MVERLVANEVVHDFFPLQSLVNFHHNMFWSHYGTQLVSNLERINYGVHKKTQRQMAINHKSTRTPTLSKSFTSRTDAKRWAIEQELKIRREDAEVAKIHFPKFEDVARKVY